MIHCMYHVAALLIMIIYFYESHPLNIHLDVILQNSADVIIGWPRPQWEWQLHAAIISQGEDHYIPLLNFLRINACWGLGRRSRFASFLIARLRRSGLAAKNQKYTKKKLKKKRDRERRVAGRGRAIGASDLDVRFFLTLRDLSISFSFRPEKP